MTYEEALDKHIGIIYKLAHKNKHALDFDDIVQELSLKLLYCVDHFDTKRGVKFSTYFWKACERRINTLKIKKYTHDVMSLDHVLEENEYGDQTTLIDLFVEVSDEQENKDKIYEDAIDFLTTLEKGYVSILQLTYGTTQTSIAQFEGVSKQYISKVHKENMEKLKNYLESSGQNLEKLL